jgi:hypothetical protein
VALGSGSLKAESVSLTDYAANKQESMDVVGMIGGFFQAVAPLAQSAPQLGPAILQPSDGVRLSREGRRSGRTDPR